jgi:hypothetical protein
MSLELAVSELSKDKQVAVKSSFKEFLDKANEYSEIIQSLEIKDVNDKEGLDQARKARLFLKNQRGDAKRLTESKRNEIKAAKMEWDILDRSWLKAFQFVEGVYKSLEEQAEEKEKYVEILEAKRKEEVRANRWKQLSEYMDFEPAGLDIMTDDVFGHVLNGAKAEKQAKIEAEKKAEEERLETERIDKLSKERSHLAMPYYQFWSDFEKTVNFGEQSASDFNNFLNRIKQAKADHDAEQARIKAENERLKKEAEEKEAKRKAEEERLIKERDSVRLKNKEKAFQAMIKIGFQKTEGGIEHSVHHSFVGERHYSELDSKEDLDQFISQHTNYIDSQNELKAEKDKQKEEARLRAIEEAKKQAELDRIKGELEAKRKEEAEKTARLQREAEDREKAELEAKKAPDKTKIKNAVDSLSLPVLELSAEGKKAYQEILNKFSGFKVWANNEVNKM